MNGRKESQEAQKMKNKKLTRRREGAKKGNAVFFLCFLRAFASSRETHFSLCLL
jgi:hypothetical protein